MLQMGPYASHISMPVLLLFCSWYITQLQNLSSLQLISDWHSVLKGRMYVAAVIIMDSICLQQGIGMVIVCLMFFFIYFFIAESDSVVNLICFCNHTWARCQSAS